jgi:hypothetical protein
MIYRKKNTLLFLTLAFIGFIISCSDSSSSDDTQAISNCPTKTCGDFSSRAQAQATYDSNKKCYKNLDADGDGIACENLSK